MQYNLDLVAAKTMGGKIEEKGAYTGVLTEAWAIESAAKNTGIHLAFKDVTGATASKLDIYTHKPDGSTLMGFNTINQIMACLQLRSMEPTLKPVEVYDYDVKGKVRTDKMSFDQLLNKPIGLILRNEQYMGKDRNGSPSLQSTIKIVMPFEAKSRKSAREILDKSTDANDVTNVLADLKDKLLPATATQSFVNSENPGFGVNASDTDDLIPF